MKNKTSKILTIGSLAFDIFVLPKEHKIVKEYTEGEIKEFYQLPFGAKVRMKETYEGYGGGAGNTAVSFNRLGIPSFVIGAVGKDKWGKMIIKHLEKENINTYLIQQIKNKKTGFSIILNSFIGGRTVLAFSGVNKIIQNIDENKLNDFAGIHLCHLSGESNKIFETVRFFLEKNPNKFLSWNPGKEQFEKGIKFFKDFLPIVNIISLNKEEAEEFTGLKAKKGSEFGEEIFDYSDIFRSFYNNGLQGIITITDGSRGAIGCDKKKIIYCPIDLNLPRLDTLGAGDAFVSTCTAEIFQKKDLKEALKSGTINAGNVVSTFGAQTSLLNKEELEKKKKEVHLEIKEIIFKK